MSFFCTSNCGLHSDATQDFYTKFLQLTYTPVQCLFKLCNFIVVAVAFNKKVKRIVHQPVWVNEYVTLVFQSFSSAASATTKVICGGVLCSEKRLSLHRLGVARRGFPWETNRYENREQIIERIAQWRRSRCYRESRGQSGRHFGPGHPVAGSRRLRPTNEMKAICSTVHKLLLVVRTTHFRLSSLFRLLPTAGV